MSKKKLLFLFLLLINISCLLATDFIDIESIKISLKNKTPITTYPDKNLNLVFNIENLSDNPLSYTYAFKLPDGFRTIEEAPSQIDITPKSNDIEFISVNVKKTTLAKDYEVIFILTCNGKTKSLTIPITVLPFHKIDIQLTDKPDFLTQNKIYTFNYMVTNNGNVSSEYNIEFLNTEQKLKILDYPKTIYLALGQNKLIPIKIETAKDIPKDIKAFTYFKVTNKEDYAQSNRAILSILPTRNVISEPYEKIYMSIQANSYKQAQEDVKTEYTFSGNKKFDAIENSDLSFVVKSNNTSNKINEIFLNNKEYFIRYSDIYKKIEFGDNSFPVPRQVDSGGGEGLNLFYKDFGLMYYNKKENKSEVYKDISYYFKTTDTKLHITETKKNQKSDTIVTFENLFNVSGLLFNVTLSKRTDNKADSNAYYSNIKSNIANIFFYDLTFEQKDENFINTTTDYRAGNIYALLYLDKDFLIKTNSTMYRTNLKKDPAKIMQEKIVSNINLEYKKIGITVERNQDMDVGNIPKFHMEENNYKMYFSNALTAEFQNKTDKLRNQTQSKQEYFFTQSFKINKNQRYNFYVKDTVQKEAENQNTSSDWVNNINAGFSADYDLSLIASLSLRYNTNIYKKKDVSYISNELINASLRIKNLQFSYNLYSDKINNKITDYMYASYSLPFSVPLYRRKNFYNLFIKINNQNDPKFNFNKILVRLSNMESKRQYLSIAKENGRINFYGLSKGTYAVTMDLSTVPTGLTAKQILPIDVYLDKDCNTQIDLVEACTLIVNVTQYTNDALVSTGIQYEKDLAIENLKNIYKLSNILVEIKSNGRLQRKLTDSNGNAVFSNLITGDYDVKVFDSQMPEFHYLQDYQRKISLKSKDKKTIDAKVVPKKRLIKFADD
jgi:hypothetical protein